MNHFICWGPYLQVRVRDPDQFLSPLHAAIETADDILRHASADMPGLRQAFATMYEARRPQQFVAVILAGVAAHYHVNPYAIQAHIFKRLNLYVVPRADAEALSYAVAKFNLSF